MSQPCQCMQQVVRCYENKRTTGTLLASVSPTYLPMHVAVAALDRRGAGALALAGGEPVPAEVEAVDVGHTLVEAVDIG